MPASPTLTRVLTAAVLVPLVLAILFLTPLWLKVLVIAVVVILALREFFEIAAKAGMAGYPFVAFAIALFLLLEQWLAVNNSLTLNQYWPPRAVDSPDLSGSLIGYALVVALWSLATSGTLPEKLTAVASTSIGVLTIAFPLSFLVALCDYRSDIVFRLLNVGGYTDGTGVATLYFYFEPPPWMLLFTLLVVWIGDTVAYFVGRAIGRHKLAPEISPGKTWEGAGANIVGSLLVGYVFSRVMHSGPLWLLGAAAVGSVAGQIGDLFESMYKRAAGVKDSGSLLPGHGGVLDRIDALIFAAPAVWAYFTYVVR